MKKAVEKYREFQQKEPDEIIELRSWNKIPRYFYPIGRAVQLSYRSSKWTKKKKFTNYIHEWKVPPLVCVTEGMKIELDGEADGSERIDIGGGKRNNVTFLGYAIDFETDDGYTYAFDPSSKKHNYVVCSPNGRIVYVIAADKQEIYAFIGKGVRVKSDGIDG